MTANLLTEVCHDVCTELGLQFVPGETLATAIANHQVDGSGFWGGTYERTFFNVRVFNPHAPTNRQSSLASCYKWNGLDWELENLTKTCSVCWALQAARTVAACTYGYSWTPLGGKYMLNLQVHSKENVFFIITDAHSKWLKLILIPTITEVQTTHPLP